MWQDIGMKNDFVSTTEAAERLGVTTASIRNYVRAGLLPSRKLADRLCFLVADLDGFKKPLRGRPRLSRKGKR